MNNTELQSRQVLIVEDILSGTGHAMHNAVAGLANALTDRGIRILFAESVCEAGRRTRDGVVHGVSGPGQDVLDDQEIGRASCRERVLPTV